MRRRTHLFVFAAALGGCVDDGAGLNDTDAGLIDGGPADRGVNDGGAVPDGATSAQDAGDVDAAGEDANDAGSLQACSLIDIELATDVAVSVDSLSLIDLRFFGNELHATWTATSGLVLARLDLEGQVLDKQVLLEDTSAETPRVFWRDGRPRVIARIDGRRPPQPTSVLAVIDDAGVESLLAVEGVLFFGIDHAAQTPTQHPALAVSAFDFRSGVQSAEVRTQAGQPAAPLATPGEIYELTKITGGYALASWDNGVIEVSILTDAGVAIGPVRTFGALDRPLGRSFDLRTDAAGDPILFYNVFPDRLASVFAQRLNTSAPAPIQIQSRAGIFEGFAMSVDRHDGGWAIAWPDFRDSYDDTQSNYYAPRNLYFTVLNDDGSSASGDDRLIVDGEGDDIAFATMAALPEGRFAAAYIRASSRSLHVVLGDFPNCPVRPDHPFQTR